MNETCMVDVIILFLICEGGIKGEELSDIFCAVVRYSGEFFFNCFR